MLRKILFSTAIMVLTTGAALANPAPYVGVGTGIINNTSDVKIGTNNFSGGSYRGVPFNLFAGYGGVVNDNFYLAGEVFGTVATANLNDEKGLKTSYTYGVAILPGLMLSDNTLAYARIGLLRSRFSDAGENRTGASFGVGVQTCLTQNVDLRLGYDYVAYKSVSNTVPFPTGPAKVTVSPRSDQFTVGVVYKFD